MSDTLLYYDKHAAEFIKRTLHADMSAIYAAFTPLVPQGGTILDLGCGSGRDTQYFTTEGFHVVPLDASAELVNYTYQLTGIRPIHASFYDMTLEERYFDAVWACASLLHIPYEHLVGIIKKIEKYLKSNGILYVSFKFGTFEGMRNGRYFTDMTEDRMENLMRDAGKFQRIRQWISEDIRPDRTEHWLNVIYRHQ